MAKKAKIEVQIKDKLKEFDGYEVNPKLGLFLYEEDKKKQWKCVHLPTGICISGDWDDFKQKRDCLLFTELLAQESINWNFKTDEEALELNPNFFEIYKRLCAQVNGGEK